MQLKYITKKESLPYICQGFFDPCEEVQRTSAEYLMACVPTFAGEDRIQTLPPELICDSFVLASTSLTKPCRIRACWRLARTFAANWMAIGRDELDGKSP